MSRKLELKITPDKQPLAIAAVFVILVIVTLGALFPLVSSSIQTKSKVEESANRLSVLQKNLQSERTKMNTLRQAQESKTGEAINLKNSLNSMLWTNSKDVKYYFYELSKTLKVSIVTLGTEKSSPGQYYTKVEYPMVISGNYNSVIEYIYMIENADNLTYIGSNNAVIEQLGNGRVQAAFTVEADTR